MSARRPGTTSTGSRAYAASEAQLQPVGQALYELLQAMAADYGQEPAYQVAARLFSEQYRVAAETAQAKANQEISASSLQSLDDLEATYREKNRVGYKGYVANVTETCDPAEPPATDHRCAGGPQHDRRWRLARPRRCPSSSSAPTWTRSTPMAPTADRRAIPVLREQQVTLIQTAIQGRKPDPAKLASGGFCHHARCAGRPTRRSPVPQGQTVPVTPGGKPQRFAAEFASATCETCPLYTAGRCPPQPDNRRRSLRLTFDQAEVEKAQRHRRSRAAHQPASNLRAAVESTVRSLKHPFPAGKLPVRGLFRMTCLIVASAAMTNVRRIQRYRLRTRPAAPERQENRRGGQRSRGAALAAHFSGACGAVLRLVFPPLAAYTLRFSC